jgi:hypothetical protein
MPPKPKKSKPEMAREANEHYYKTLFEPGEVATMSVSAGLSRIKDALAVPPEPEPQAPPPPPAPQPEPDLGPGAADWLGAMLMGGPAAVEALQQQQQQQQPPPLPGFGNIPPVQAPPGLPSLIEYGPIPPPEKRPVGRPRSSSTGPKPPPPVKVEATDSQLSKRVLLETKIKAYMRIRPVLAEMVRVPTPGSPIEDFEWCLAQCRQCLSWGTEEKALKMAIGTGANVLEQALPYLREWAPEGYAAALNGEGFASDLHRAMDERNQEPQAMEFRECLSLCAVDLIGWVSMSPWAMLGFSALAMFTQRVKENNQALLEGARARAMTNGVSLGGGVQTDGL